MKRFAPSLPRDLKAVSQIDFRFVFQLEGAAPAVESVGYDITTIFKAIVEFGSDGKPKSCKNVTVDISPKPGFADFCSSVSKAGFTGMPYSPDPQGLSRKVDVSYTIAVKRR